MSKNKPMSRIDLDYRKNLKYPDINDYLNDTRYASNLTEFPDNQAGAVTAFKLIPGTTQPSYKIEITPNFKWTVFLGSFKLYGYNPDLEAIEKMVLTIDFLNDDDTALNYTKTIRRRNTPILFNVIGPSDPRSLPLVGAVNYFVDFDPTDLEDIYNYVFGRRWLQASEHYEGKIYENDGSEADKKRFRNYVKYRIYTLKIPATIEYYYVNATEPGGVLKFTITLRELLPAYRNKIDFNSKNVSYNAASSASQLDHFILSFTSNSIGEMQLGGYIEGKKSAAEADPLMKPVGNTESSEIKTSLLANQLFIQQHSGYDLSYPKLIFTYDFYIGPDKYLILNNEEFETFTPVPRRPRVDVLTIDSYRYGHKIKKTDVATDNNFSVVIDFSCGIADLEKNIHRRKFKLEFRQSKLNSQPDEDGIFKSNSLEALLIAGSINQNNLTGTRTLVGDAEIEDTNMYRSNTFNPVTGLAQMVSQRVAEKISNAFKQPQLSQFASTLVFKEGVGERYKYTLTLTWPKKTSLTGLYIIPKSRWILLSIADSAQQTFLSGRIEKPVWQRDENDDVNPMYNLDYFDQPLHLIQGLVSKMGVTPLLSTDKFPERNSINGTPVKPSHFADKVQVGDKTEVLRLRKSDFSTSGTKSIQFKVQNYIFNGRDFYTDASSPFVMLHAYIMLAHKIGQAQNFTYLTKTGNAGNPIIYYKTYLKSYNVDATGAQLNLVLDQQEFTKMMVDSTRSKNNKLPGGTYKVYIIPNLTRISTGDVNQRLYRSSFLNPSKKFSTELLIEYEWSA